MFRWIFGKPKQLTDRYDKEPERCSFSRSVPNANNPIVHTHEMWIYSYMRFPWEYFLRNANIKLRLCATCAETGMLRLHANRHWSPENGQSYLSGEEDLFDVRLSELLADLPDDATIRNVIHLAVLAAPRARLVRLSDKLREFDREEQRLKNREREVDYRIRRIQDEADGLERELKALEQKREQALAHHTEVERQLAG